MEESAGTWVYTEASYEEVVLADMNPAPYNPRYDLQPGDLAYERLKKSIIKSGLIQPIVWNRQTGNIISGHQRYKILVAMGAEKVICAVVEKTPEKEMAANLAMNKAAGRFENVLLKKMFEKLDRDTTDYEAMGFDEDEVDHLLTGLDELADFDGIFDPTLEPEPKPAMVRCPHCGQKFEERDNRVQQ